MRIVAPPGRHVHRLEACREVIRAFRQRTRVVVEVAWSAGLTTALAEDILSKLGWTQEALAREIWLLARWRRMSYCSRTYMEEAFHWWQAGVGVMHPLHFQETER